MVSSSRGHGVSASKSALLLSPCLLWAGGAREYQDEYADTTKRDKGTLFHLAMERYYADGEKWLKVCQHLEDVTHWARQAIQWSKDVLEPRCESIHTEIYVASKFRTGDVHSDTEVRERKYPKRPGYLPGTADLVCVLHTGELLVADWKTGGSAGADKQLLSLAYGLQRVYTLQGNLRSVRLAVLSANNDGVMPSEWAVTNQELEAHADAMAFQLADVGVRNEPVPGSHCTQLYCPHLAYCPAIGAVVEQLGRDGKACTN